jgi:aspartyl-tRNA(Asn)/glutamyl-tRNA(Gln) amidotransferase subunit A
MNQDRRDFLQDSARLGAFALTSAAALRIEPSLAQTVQGSALATMTIVELAQLLVNQKITSRQLVEQALVAIKDPKGEGSRTFLSVHETEALAAADRVDAQRRDGAKLPALAGIPISIKDLFDEDGVTTLGGSKALVGTAAATRDSTVVERLKKAGAVVIGRTNLVEFAYSGLGINPHYGTPKNVFDRASGRIPGGSSSGAVVSVSDGMAAGAIGTDTGGSIRIPAGLNGLVGFKPTARRVPLDGVLPLAFTLDSAGRSQKPSPTVHCSIRSWLRKPTAFQRPLICVACVLRCPAQYSRSTCPQLSPRPSRRRSFACRLPVRRSWSYQWLNSRKPQP